ncbi:MAG: polyphosphate kinase 2 family protein [Pseudonocardia sp.]|nr:polyphosphate kinase 2 family protein [Pseudonocardia sp.]
MASVRETFRVPQGPVDLTAIDPRGRPTGPKDRAAAAKAVTELGTRLDAGQEALYAEGAGGGTRSVLLVLQGMDTSGKGGVISHAVGLVNPQGVQIASFKKPTAEERRHDFLWRIRKQLPGAGRIGVFDRSHYEDVLVVRVEELVPTDVWQARYGEIREFEAELAAQGVTIAKVMLHISPEEQAERLLARLDDPHKRWKYNPGDLDARARWDDYQEAYATALELCDSDAAPWYVVPSDRKWYRNWAVAAILAETLDEMAPAFPEPDFDVAAERTRLLRSTNPSS